MSVDRTHADVIRERIKDAAAVANNDSPDTLAFVAIRDGEAWNDRRLPEVGRALAQALSEIDSLMAALAAATERADRWQDECDDAYRRLVAAREALTAITLLRGHAAEIARAAVAASGTPPPAETP